MKLQELAVVSPTKQAAKVFESYFGDRISFDAMNGQQARSMLKRVRGLIAEHRRTPEFHRSQNNPAYLKLVMMEQALNATVREDGAPNPVPQTTTQQKQAGATHNKPPVCKPHRYNRNASSCKINSRPHKNK